MAFKILQALLKIIELLEAILLAYKEANLYTKSILTFKEAMIYTDLSDSTLYKKVSNQEIEHSKPAGKIYFRREILDSFMESNTIKKRDNNKKANEYLQKKLNK